MGDYISRAALAEVLVDNKSRKAIAAAESVPLKKIVLCKECAHAKRLKGSGLLYCEALDSCRMKKNDYCSKGVMRNGTSSGKGI